MAKKGEKYKCEACGLIIVVDDPCGCQAVELVCCEAPMKSVNAVTKPKPKAKAKTKPKTKKK